MAPCSLLWVSLLWVSLLSLAPVALAAEPKTDPGFQKTGPPPSPTWLTLDPHERVRWSVCLGISGTSGGDDLVETDFVGGGGRILSAGSALTALLGTRVVPIAKGPHALALTFELGVSGDGSSGANGGVTFRHFPVQGTVQYVYRMFPFLDWSVGVGPQYESGVKLTGSGDFEELNVSFDSALGLRFQTGVYFDTGAFGLEVALHATSISYQLRGGSDDVSGNSIGLLLFLHWGIMTDTSVE